MNFFGIIFAFGLFIINLIPVSNTFCLNSFSKCDNLAYNYSMLALGAVCFISCLVCVIGIRCLMPGLNFGTRSSYVGGIGLHNGYRYGPGFGGYNHHSFGMNQIGGIHHYGMGGIHHHEIGGFHHGIGGFHHGIGGHHNHFGGHHGIGGHHHHFGGHHGFAGHHHGHHH